MCHVEIVIDDLSLLAASIPTSSPRTRLPNNSLQVTPTRHLKDGT